MPSLVKIQTSLPVSGPPEQILPGQMLLGKWSWDSGSQKDRHRGTSGAKEGFSSIGRFG